MTVAQLLDELMKMPLESGGGLSRVVALDFFDAEGPGAPAEVILLPSTDE